MTPWHSSIAVGADGTFRTVHAASVRETHDLVYQDGRPHHFRERSPLYDLGETQIEFEHLYPCGLVIRPTPTEGEEPEPSYRSLDAKKLRQLAEIQSPVVLRGFAETTDRELFINSAQDIGEVSSGPSGVLQEIKEHYFMSSDARPMHYDGMFNIITQKDEQGKEIKIQKSPK